MMYHVEQYEKELCDPNLTQLLKQISTTCLDLDYPIEVHKIDHMNDKYNLTIDSHNTAKIMLATIQVNTLLNAGYS